MTLSYPPRARSERALPVAAVPAPPERHTDYPASRREAVVDHLHGVEVGGLRTTSVPRTVADVLRTRRPPHGLAVLEDAAQVELEIDRDRAAASSGSISSPSRRRSKRIRLLSVCSTPASSRTPVTHSLLVR